MKVKVSLEHPNGLCRGKTGKVFSVKYKTRKLYQYSNPSEVVTENDDPSGNTGKIIIPFEHFMLFHERNDELIERGFEEHVREIPTDEIESADVDIETVNAVSKDGMHTLVAVSPMAHRMVTIEGKYLEVIK